MQRLFLSKLRRAAALCVSAMLSVSLLSTSVFAEGSLPAEDRNGDGIINVFDYVLEKRDTVDACSPFTLDISDATGIAGETVWLDVSIENNPGLTNVSFMLGYNPELKPFLNEEQRVIVDDIRLLREFELMFVEGRVREQAKPPYNKYLRQQPLDYKIKWLIKCTFPKLHRLYRKKRGYSDY